MIVVLVITVIVIGLAFSVLNLVQKQITGIGENFGQRTEVNLLRQAFWIDFNKYSEVTYDAQNDVIRCKNEVGGIQYQFNDNTIIREVDTLRISISDKTFYFDGNEVFSGEIDAIRIISAKEEGAKVIFVYKNNTAETYIH